MKINTSRTGKRAIDSASAFITRHSTHSIDASLFMDHFCFFRSSNDLCSDKAMLGVLSSAVNRLIRTIESSTFPARLETATKPEKGKKNNKSKFMVSKSELRTEKKKKMRRKETAGINYALNFLNNKLRIYVFLVEGFMTNLCLLLWCSVVSCFGFLCP